MRVTITGATGLIGTKLVRALRERGDEVVVLSRSPEKARETLGVEGVGWDPSVGPAPAAGFAGSDAVVHLAGENVAQRWSAQAKERILESRRTGTRNLVHGVPAMPANPTVAASSSAVGSHGKDGDEELGEDASPGSDFLA